MSESDPLASRGPCPAGQDGPIGEPGSALAKPKRGRPRCAEEDLSSISVWLPVTAQDRIIRLAQQRRQTPSAYLRDVLVQLFTAGRG